MADYASFSSLIWQHVTDADDNPVPHFWTWKGYIIFGVGVSPTGVGGLWYAFGIIRQDDPFRTQFDAQASVETYHLAWKRRLSPWTTSTRFANTSAKQFHVHSTSCSG